MIKRVLEQQKTLSDVLSADRKSRHLVPTWQDVDVLESINQALQPRQEFIDALSSESYVSISYVKPVHVFNTSVLATKELDSDLTKSIKKKILEYLKSKYDNSTTQELLDMACLMDPRFNAGYISSDNLHDIKAKVISETEATFPKEQSHDVHVITWIKKTSKRSQKNPWAVFSSVSQLQYLQQHHHMQ